MEPMSQSSHCGAVNRDETPYKRGPSSSSRRIGGGADDDDDKAMMTSRR